MVPRTQNQAFPSPPPVGNGERSGLCVKGEVFSVLSLRYLSGMETEANHRAIVSGIPNQERNQRLARRHKRIGVVLAVIGLIGVFDTVTKGAITASLVIALMTIVSFDTAVTILSYPLGIVKGFWILFLAAALGESIRAKRITVGKASKSFRMWS